MAEPLRKWPWLTLQIIAANVAVILSLAVAWYWAFMQQSSVYSERLMSTFNIQPGQLHAMYVDDVEQQLWNSVMVGLIAATLASIGLAWLIVRPLRSLARATDWLRNGDYSVRSSVSRGEVGNLARNINALAAALEQEEHRRNQYMADLSHELRTPITNLRGYTEGLEDGVVAPDERFFRLMADELSQLTALTRTIDSLELATTDLETDAHPRPVAEWVHDAAERWGERLSERGLTIECRIAVGLGTHQLAVSQTSVRHILDNLMSNMVRYAQPTAPCVITVQAGTTVDCVRIAFCNAAPDVDAAALPFLFDRFYRVSASRTRALDTHASGLGLAIVKHLCKAAGGHVEAALEAERLIITVELPVRVDTP